jgi:hypothetical protein
MSWNRELLDEDTRSVRIVEEAALAIIVEQLPRAISESELADCMTIECQVQPSVARLRSISDAVAGLVAVGLLRRGQRSILEPTPAACRAAELELGL